MIESDSTRVMARVAEQVRSVRACIVISVLLLSFAAPSHAKLELSNLFSDHAVLQQNVPFDIWGWADPGESIEVSFLGKRVSTKADANGKWRASFPAQQAGDSYVLTVKGSHETIERSDICFGEVWVFSGQSNMGTRLPLSVDADLELLSVNDPLLRCLRIHNPSSATPQYTVDGSWALTTRETASSPTYSAVSYYIGRELRRILGVPVGIIRNNWSGSPAEAWVPRETLSQNPRFKQYVEILDEELAGYNYQEEVAAHKQAISVWKEQVKECKARGKKAPRRPANPKPYQIYRPGGYYNSMICPLTGHKVRGIFWYQGESNIHYPNGVEAVSGAYNYRYLLPLVIENYRNGLGQGDLPFYLMQLPNFGQWEKPDHSPYAEIRESMTRVINTITNTGQAVTIDLGEERDLHPHNKKDMALRLVRWPLAREYGYDIAYRSPEYQRHTINGNRVTISFQHVEQLVLYGDIDVKGFEVAGEDRVFKSAKALLTGNHIVAWSDEVPRPVAVRYAWAGSPECNIYSEAFLPLTPFRTDDWRLGSQPERRKTVW
jgi:sialate O-acetylesterase